MYNKRTWLNKENSPSIGSVVAFDGDVKYSDGSERTTFLALSDCGKTIKLTRNTESIEDFIDKIKLLRSEIDSFIDYLTQKNELVKADVMPSFCNCETPNIKIYLKYRKRHRMCLDCGKEIAK